MLIPYHMCSAIGNLTMKIVVSLFHIKLAILLIFFIYVIDAYESDSDQLQDVEQWYQQPADIPNTPTQNLIMLYVAIVLFNFST